MKNKTRLFNLLIIITLFLSACNLPSSGNVEDLASTAAAQTVEALLSATPISDIAVPPSFTPSPIVPATLTPIPLPISTNTPVATATSNCNVAQFITDVTIPDGTIMIPGQAFVKKWRLKNVGSCSWTGFSLVFDSGDSMGGPASQAIATVNPGQEVDLEVNLTAPATVGNYKGHWRIVTNGSVLVPVINGSQGKTFYLDIKVQNPVIVLPPVVFAVTSVTFNVTGSCPNYSYTYSVTVNAPGTVELYRVFGNGGTDATPATLTFLSAGTKVSGNNPVFAPPGGTWTDIYIDSPNNQQFGRANFPCP